MTAQQTSHEIGDVGIAAITIERRWSPKELLDLLNRNVWFARQPSSLQEAVVCHGRVAHLAGGRLVHSEGDLPSGLWAVLSGSTRVEASVGPDRMVLLDLVGPGGIVGQSSSFGGGPRQTSVRTAEPSTLLLVSDNSIKTIANQHPAIWRAIGDLLFSQLEYNTRRRAQAMCLTPRARVAAALIYVPSAPFLSGFLKVSQVDLAELAALSRKTVNGHIQDFQREKLIRTSYRGIQILDRPRLKRLAFLS